MRNTQPLYAAAPVGGRIEWRESSLQSRPPDFVADRSGGRILKRLQGVLKGVVTRERKKSAKNADEERTKPSADTPVASSAVRWREDIHPGDDYAGIFNGSMIEASPVACPGWKRMLDLALVISTLPCWLAVMILVTLWIKLSSPGPTFYRQERIGHCGRRFMILKFRSMQVNVETRSHEQHLEQLIKANTPMEKLDVAGDPRLIPGGRLLRALGLDELPQLVNVLRGEMSLVGPRPCTPKEFEHYDIWHQERVKAPPGLTGFWQVNGKNKTTFTEMIAMDIFYAEHMSLCLDLEIILKTGAAVGAQVGETHLKSRFRSWRGKSA